MRKLCLILLLVLLALSAVCVAENGDPFQCTCGFDAQMGETCACFLQKGDTGPAVNGVIEHLKEKGYLPFSHARGVFDEEVTESIRRFQRDLDLNETGVMDHETMSYLLSYDVFPDFLFVQEEDVLVWVPTGGGKRYHTTPECSNMLAPRKISQKNASALGIELCAHCRKRGGFQ